MVIQLPQNVKNILDKYDINDLLIRAIPKNYHIANSAYLEIYKIKTKFDTPVTITLTNTATQVLKSFADNYANYTHIEILSYLIETVCDLSKVHTKDISTALNKYYSIAETDKIRWATILDAYSNSLYYPRERKNDKRRNNTNRRFD